MNEFVALIIALSVSFFNGANDNFKGFATVWGSKTLNYRSALILATLATIAGSLASMWIAEALIKSFTGKGIVPDGIAASPDFILSVAVGASLTIALATKYGLPISTTHALIGGLVGSGLAYPNGAFNVSPLIKTFLLPLLLSPIAAAFLTMFLARWVERSRKLPDCACIADESQPYPLENGALVRSPYAVPTVVLARAEECASTPELKENILPAALDKAHIGSAMAICFSRGVNDTPKLAALAISVHGLGESNAIILIALAMGIGGVIYSYRVAKTMSQKIVQIDHKNGFVANLVTAFLVLFASKLGFPVSTTHVAVGAISGIGLSGNAIVDKSAIRNILISWVATLPLSMAVSYLFEMTIS
ncbi:MAG: inorganic phosphate transporter [Betaproteobacteria bacterium]|nr:inorganic phosphate transporter [Betaproteobacteria bacterium]